MRRFSSYGPPNRRAHFCVERRELVDACVEQLVGRPEEEGGHYFTIWAPRQTGKTWLMERASEEIERRFAGQFLVARASVEGIVIYDEQPAEVFLERVPWWVEQTFHISLPGVPSSWEELQRLFSREHERGHRS